MDWCGTVREGALLCLICGGGRRWFASWMREGGTRGRSSSPCAGSWLQGQWRTGVRSRTHGLPVKVRHQHLFLRNRRQTNRLLNRNKTQGVRGQYCKETISSPVRVCGPKAGSSVSEGHRCRGGGAPSHSLCEDTAVGKLKLPRS